jgi:hypothetical protein
MFTTEFKAFNNAKKAIKDYINFTSVESVKEADEQYNEYLCAIQQAFVKMRDEKLWTLEDATRLHWYAMDMLAERYYNCLFAFEKRAMCNWKFF